MGFYYILHDAAGSHILLDISRSKNGSLYLPEIDRRLENGHKLGHSVYTHLTRRTLDPLEDPPVNLRYNVEDESGGHVVQVFEAIGQRRNYELRSRYAWQKIDSELIKKIQKRYSHLIARAVSNIESESVQNSLCETVPLFARSGFMSQLKQDIRSQLQNNGYDIPRSVQHKYTSTCSIIFQINVGERGHLFYKMSVPGCPEARFTYELAKLVPGYVLKPFGVDTTNNSFFTRNFGRSIFECDIDLVLDGTNMLAEQVARRVARFHQETARHVDRLRQVGMEDTSPRRMRDQLSHFIYEMEENRVLNASEGSRMRSLQATISSKLDELSNGRIPLSACHGDLHFGNITMPSESGQYPLLFDWFESSISHPFFDVVDDNDFYSLCVQKYRAAWSRYESSEGIKRLMRTASYLSTLWRAFSGWQRYLRRGHRLGAEKCILDCRSSLRRLIETFEEGIE